MSKPLETQVHDAIQGDVSPYRLAAIVSAIGTHKVKPQMVYNYCKKGLIPTTTNQLGHLQVPTFEARAWARKYLAAQLERDTVDA